MSTEQHKTGHEDGQRPLHEDVSYEPRDIRVNTIIKIMIGLGIFVIFSFFLIVFVYHALTDYWSKNYAAPVPMHTELGATMPPEPRLQGAPGHLTDAQEDLRQKIKRDTDANNTLGWIDEKSGLAQIPVSDAMKLLVQKGFPAAAAPAGEKKG